MRTNLTIPVLITLSLLLGCDKSNGETQTSSAPPTVVGYNMQLTDTAPITEVYAPTPTNGFFHITLHESTVNRSFNGVVWCRFKIMDNGVVFNEYVAGVITDQFDLYGDFTFHLVFDFPNTNFDPSSRYIDFTFDKDNLLNEVDEGDNFLRATVKQVQPLPPI
jgi:hypothetical protein